MTPTTRFTIIDALGRYHDDLLIEGRLLARPSVRYTATTRALRRSVIARDLRSVRNALREVRSDALRMPDYSRSRHAHADSISCAVAGEAGHPPFAMPRLDCE